MKLNNKELYELYRDKGIKFLYHANTVRTSKTFIEQNGLLSRGDVENKGLVQTSQSSDEIDKKYDVWDDIFLDTADLHIEFNRQNHYGPVLFKFSVDFIRDLDMEIWVTKDNPKNWNSSLTMAERYFVDVDELRQDWNKYQKQRKMTTIRKTSEPLLFGYLEEIIVENPHIRDKETGIVYFDKAVEELKESVKLNSSVAGISKERICNGCFCHTNYLHEVSRSDLQRLFL